MDHPITAMTSTMAVVISIARPHLYRVFPGGFRLLAPMTAVEGMGRIGPAAQSFGASCQRGAGVPITVVPFSHRVHLATRAARARGTSWALHSIPSGV